MEWTLLTNHGLRNPIQADFVIKGFWEYLGWFYWSCFTNSNSSIRFWNEPRCARKYAGIEKYHPEFCLDVHDFSPLFAPPPPPLPPPPPANDLAQGGFGDQAIALAVTPEKKKSQLHVNADKINAKFTIGYYSIIFKFSFIQILLWFSS